MRLFLDGLPLTERMTGVGRYTYELAYALADNFAGDRIEVISPLPFIDHVKTVEVRPPNLSFTEIRTNRLTRHWWTVGLPFHLAKSGATLFHGTNFDIPLLYHGARILTVHDLSTLLYPQTHRPHVVRRARWRLPLMVKTATYVIVPADSIKREIVDNLGIDQDKIVVIPEAPRRHFAPMDRDRALQTLRRFKVKEDFILFVGTIEPRKNLNRLLDAFERLISRSERDDLQLVIAGRYGWMMDDFLKRIDILERRGIVKWLGYVSDDDLRALYSTCLFFIYPSLYEGFGLPLLEAMSCGAPVITSRASAISETVGDAVLIADPIDVRSIFEAMFSLLCDADKRRSLSIAGLNRAGLFAWDKTARLTYEVYLKALKERGK